MKSRVKNIFNPFKGNKKLFYMTDVKTRMNVKSKYIECKNIFL